MQGNNRADLPVPEDGIQRRVHVMAKLLAVSKGQCIGDITGQDISLVVVARPPI